MDDLEVEEPLPQVARRNIFILLVGLFVISLPFLFLYAAGYRIDFGKADPFISTGGLYVAADRTGSEIYIDGELVRETRTFRTAFYAQGLEPGTHRVHVQKPGSHTWVKELPVYAHIVTEAQAFNMPLVPRVRTISPWKNSAGDTVVRSPAGIVASSSNTVLLATSTPTRLLIPDTEYATLLQSFASSSPAATVSVEPLFSGVSENAATTTKEFSGVQLSEIDGEVYASFVGPREQMPYYYCAKDFEYSENPFEEGEEMEEEMLVGPVQYVPADAECDPVIRIDSQGEKVNSFDFYPGSFDLVLMALENGIYVVEVDNRAWQNAQPLMLGEELSMRVENGNIYVYDGTLIYQVLLDV